MIGLAFSLAFSDVFIIALSSSLAFWFQQINARLRNCGMTATTLTFWLELRADYIRLCRLCHLVNDEISFLIFLSFANNLETILFKLYQSIK